MAFALTAVCSILSFISSTVLIAGYLQSDVHLQIIAVMGFGLAASFGYIFTNKSLELSDLNAESVLSNIETGSVNLKTPNEKSRLANIDLETIQDNLDMVLNQQKIYTELDLTLPRLAQSVNISSHQLSEYLNRHLGIKFNDFINEFRVIEAKKLLENADNNTSILDIAYMAGFNAKSSFNLIFKKYTGLTPSQYRDKFSQKPA